MVNRLANRLLFYVNLIHLIMLPRIDQC